MRKARILLTAFDPFGGETVNPSAMTLEAVSAPEGVILRKIVVPTSFSRALETVGKVLRDETFDAVVCLGQAGGRDGISVERIAVNIDDASIPDNDGAKPCGTRISDDGPAAYFSTLPVDEICRAAGEAGVKAYVSNSAGTFVCNHLMYGVLHMLRDRQGIRAGFIHLPYLPEQAQARREKEGKEFPFMTKDGMVRGIEAALSAVRDSII